MKKTLSYRKEKNDRTHIILTDAAIVYPIATPNKFKYWMSPHSITFFPPAIKMDACYYYHHVSKV